MAARALVQVDTVWRDQSAVLLELVLDRPFMFDQRSPEGFHGGKEPLLKAGPQERRGVADFQGFVTETGLAKGTIGFQLDRELELGRAFDRGLDSTGSTSRCGKVIPSVARSSFRR